LEDVVTIIVLFPGFCNGLSAENNVLGIFQTW